MERYATGDEAAFAEVYDAVAPRLMSFFRRQGASGAEVEDLTQQTLLHMHRARGSFIAGADVLPWAFAIGRRLFIDGIRKRREISVPNYDWAEVEATSASGEQEAEARDLERVVRRVLLGLPESQRTAYELVKQDGLSLSQAAEVLGITVGALKLRTHRAYEALRAAVGRELDGIEQDLEN
jgi:RNA polymerase sigma-70 factor (ECF subfamily)